MKQTTSAARSLLNEHEAAAFLSVHVTTLRDWRFRKVGPGYVKYLNKAVRYRLEALATFVEQSRVKTAA
jgi:hypothetical protein